MRALLYIMILLVLFSGRSNAISFPGDSDTIRLDDVMVTGRSALRGAGFLRTSVNRSLLLSHQSGSLSEILSAGSHLHIKSYGPGGIATISFRGAGASHTVVRWNGINLNNPMLGQTDLITLPTIAADRISLYYGGASVGSGIGGLGGVVEIDTRPSWSDAGRSDIQYSAGSFGRESLSAIVRYGKEKLRYSTRIGVNSARNDFSYINRYLTGEDIAEKRDNASFSQKMLLQEVFIRGENSVTAARLWIQETERQIPVAANISPSSHNEQLINRFQRAMISHDHAIYSATWSAVVAFNREEMIYSDRVTGLYSPSVGLKLLAKTTFNRQLAKESSILGELVWENDNVMSENYSENRSRSVVTLSGSADHRLSDIIDSNIGFAIPVTQSKLSAPDLSASIELTPLPDKNSSIRFNIATKSRMPTMNDLYWNPGGNRELMSERAVNSEMAVSLAKESRLIKLDMSYALFRNRIRNMIFWQPGQTGLWSPVNLGEIKSYGMELTSSLNYSGETFSAALQSLYSYTVSGEEYEEEFYQLIYVPRHAAANTFSLSYGNVFTEISLRLTGKRYITSDNREFLPSYGVADITAGLADFNISGNTSLSIALTAENIFKTEYQSIAYHPMPGRSYLIRLNLMWKGSNKK